jgi:small acid-soluble spore protein F (minor alpha/beta-type SASP)
MLYGLILNKFRQQTMSKDLLGVVTSQAQPALLNREKIRRRAKANIGRPDKSGTTGAFEQGENSTQSKSKYRKANLGFDGQNYNTGKIQKGLRRAYMSRRRGIMSEQFKMELAKDLGIYDTVQKEGWGGVTTRDAGNLVKRAIEIAEQTLANQNQQR